MTHTGYQTVSDLPPVLWTRHLLGIPYPQKGTLHWTDQRLELAMNPKQQRIQQPNLSTPWWKRGAIRSTRGPFRTGMTAWATSRASRTATCSPRRQRNMDLSVLPLADEGLWYTSRTTGPSTPCSAASKTSICSSPKHTAAAFAY